MEGRLSADKKQLELAFTNSRQRFGDRTSGAPFNVYAPGIEPVRTWAYGVKPGDTLKDNWPLHEFQDQRYHLCVYGPNGFFREFRGDESDPLVDIQLTDAGSANPNGLLHLKNQQAHSCVVGIVDHAYGVSYPPKTLAAGSATALTLPFGSSHGWYDLSVTVHGYKNFEKRYAGRIETGSHSISDPFMGRAMKA